MYARARSFRCSPFSVCSSPTFRSSLLHSDERLSKRGTLGFVVFLPTNFQSTFSHNAISISLDYEHYDSAVSRATVSLNKSLSPKHGVLILSHCKTSLNFNREIQKTGPINYCVGNSSLKLLKFPNGLCYIHFPTTVPSSINSKSATSINQYHLQM